MQEQLIVEMDEEYPFGEMRRAVDSEDTVMVHKELRFEREEEFEMIRDMIHFLKAAKHEYLVNISKVVEQAHVVHVYYEYVPLKLERWIFDVDEKLIEEIEEKMIELAEYLTRCSLKFSLNPNLIGINRDMNVKYFLSEFEVDLQNQQFNFQTIKAEITAYFQQIGKEWKTERKEQSGLCNNQMQLSVSTNQSLSPYDSIPLKKYSSQINVQSMDNPMMRSITLSKKIQNSKKKCLQILQKFKKGSK